MLKAILVGLDGSAYADSAVDLGLRWAKRFDALLVGIGIIDRPGIVHSPSLSLGSKRTAEATTFEADRRRKVEGVLERFALRCAEADVAYKLLEDVGKPWQQLVQEAERYDLILLGKKTYFQFDTEEGVDETLLEVVRHTARPVVTAPEILEGQGVLVAYDGSFPAARAMQSFQGLGLDEGETVHVLSVATDYGAAARCADRGAEFLRFHEVNAQSLPVASHDPASQVILAEVRRFAPRMLVMGSHAKPAWQELLFGSVTRRMLATSPVPVFLCQ